MDNLLCGNFVDISLFRSFFWIFCRFLARRTRNSSIFIPSNHYFLFLVLAFSIPASLAASIKSRSILGFRKVPSGMLVSFFVLLNSYTGYLKPSITDHSSPAYLRFVILHEWIVTPIVLLVLLRWLVLMIKTIKASSLPQKL